MSIHDSVHNLEPVPLVPIGHDQMHLSPTGSPSPVTGGAMLFVDMQGNLCYVSPKGKKTVIVKGP